MNTDLHSYNQSDTMYILVYAPFMNNLFWVFTFVLLLFLSLLIILCNSSVIFSFNKAVAHSVYSFVKLTV